MNENRNEPFAPEQRPRTAETVPGSPSGRAATMVGPDTWTLLVLWVGLPLLGVAAGWFLIQLAGWAESVSWMPYQGPLELIDSLPGTPAMIGAIVLGTLAGVAFGAYGYAHHLHVTVADDQAAIKRASGLPAERLPRTVVTAVFVDGKSLVLLGTDTEELFRTTSDTDDGQLREVENAFRSHGWPWSTAGDPYGTEYQRWVPDTPALPPGTNALLKARENALRRGDKDDAAQLRSELARLDVVVRDDKKNRQFWRRTRGPAQLNDAGLTVD